MVLFVSFVPSMTFGGHVTHVHGSGSCHKESTWAIQYCPVLFGICIIGCLCAVLLNAGTLYVRHSCVALCAVSVLAADGVTLLVCEHGVATLRCA